MMSTSILKSPASQRRRISKVHFELPVDLRPVLLDFVTGSDPKAYEELVKSLNDNVMKEEQKVFLLHNCCKAVGVLDPQVQKFVIAVLNLEWVHYSEELYLAYQQFVVELLAAHNYYTKITLERLLGLFIKVPKDSEIWPDAEPCKEDFDAFTRIHEVISRVLKVIPMAGEMLVQVATAGFPYMRRSPKEHQVIVYNLLRVCEYQPVLRPELLTLIISRMIAIDVQIPRELLEEELDKCDESDDDQMEVDGCTEADTSTVFSMDDVPSISQNNSSRSFTTSMKQREMQYPMAQTLDLLMEQLFVFIKQQCELDKLPSNWHHHRELYRELCAVFEKQLLLTHGSHHVQFIMFFLCSLRPPTLIEHFINLLWTRVTQPGETAVSRQSATCYVSSLLARARFASPRLLRSTLAQMADWCHCYVATQQDATSCDVRQHPVFYTVCQSLFYVVAFRHADLVNTNKGLLWTQSLGLGKLVTSRLNPLKPCLPGVAQNFAAVTRTYQLAYCYTVLERNARAVLPCINQHSGQALVSRLSSFFPFDPYLLLRSGKYISGEYREYEALEQPAGPAVASVCAAGASDGEDGVTDDEEEKEEYITTQSVVKSTMSPNSLKHLVSPNSFPEMFGYGTSPGFKHV